MPFIEECAEALAGAASILARFVRGEGGADGPLRVVDRAADRRSCRQIAVASPDALFGLALVGGRQDVGEVERRLVPRLEKVRPSNDLLNRSSAQLRQVLADLFGDQEQVVDDVFRASGELRAKVFALGRDAGGACVEVALARHVAAKRDEDAGAESELFRAEQRRHDDVAAVAQATIGAQADALAQPVRDQDLLRLGEPELPRGAGVLDRRQRRRAGATVVTRDQDVVGLRLGDARGDGPHTRLRDELHADACAWIDGLEVVNELREVLDRVDVVVRRRRDELLAGLRVAQPRDEAGHLQAGQLAALARLGALSDLDLELVRALKVARRDAESRGGYLLHAIVSASAALVVVSVGVLAAFARVGARADLVHRDGESFVRFGGQRPERHRGADEALHDLARGLDLIQGHWCRRLFDMDELAQRLRLIHRRQAAPLAIGLLVTGLRRLLRRADSERVVRV